MGSDLKGWNKLDGRIVAESHQRRDLVSKSLFLAKFQKGGKKEGFAFGSGRGENIFLRPEGAHLDPAGAGMRGRSSYLRSPWSV